MAKETDGTPVHADAETSLRWDFIPLKLTVVEFRNRDDARIVIARIA